MLTSCFKTLDLFQDAFKAAPWRRRIGGDWECFNFLSSYFISVKTPELAIEPQLRSSGRTFLNTCTANVCTRAPGRVGWWPPFSAPLLWRLVHTRTPGSRPVGEGPKKCRAVIFTLLTALSWRLLPCSACKSVFGDGLKEPGCLSCASDRIFS